MIYNALAQMPKFKKGEIAPVSVNSWFDAQTPHFAEVENDAGSIKAISRGSSEERATTPRYARHDQSTLEGSKQEASTPPSCTASGVPIPRLAIRWHRSFLA